MRVAIVGAGYSGTIAAVEIARAVRGAQIILIEKSGRFARGAAYGTASPGHLLNVRARNMSALAGEPGHFAAWAAGEGHGPDDYVPRRDYRRYPAGGGRRHVECGDVDQCHRRVGHSEQRRLFDGRNLHR